MALKRATMQDIAEACGLSRNTVSKVFNGWGSVSEATKSAVLQKARELGYHQPPEEGEAPAQSSGNVAILTQHKLLSHGFGSYFITSFTDQICRAGYNIKMFEVSPEEIASRTLPPHLRLEDSVALLGIELFDRDYLDMICSLGKPTVFVDGHARASRTEMRCDFICMENCSSETALVKRMIDAGARRIGFVGDSEHCNSFNERWIGYYLAMTEAGLPVDRRLCILEKDGEQYGDPDWLLERLRAMPSIPDGFACANDYLAIHLMTALKKLGLAVPARVMVTGFDGSLEASVVSPSLATARIPSAEIGRTAAKLLCERIRFPEAPFCWVYMKTTPIWGESVR